jgi:hypothetical protein
VKLYMKGEIDGETLLRRLGVATCAATAGAVGSVAMAKLVADLPWWLAIPLVAAGGIVSWRVGHKLGGKLFLPPIPTPTPKLAVASASPGADFLTMSFEDLEAQFEKDLGF